MDKKHYYVSVQSRTILENQGDASYELEIEATPEERDQLEELFKELGEWDQATAVQVAPALGIAYHHDESNDGYDASLKAAYALIGKLGTAETQRHVASMFTAR
ncbi:hypothetical protein B5M42_013925 [Paenibacillus athensensis]|uniref:Hydrolase n=1 Tax=Paenibacillus athensensis TaxID=1967502 RepID=A0A4Y8PXG0_9BACL|nr:hypothetical protein [Paenibacillus athensensis]MCD1259930.1 hypothetical protein [Paenibacillus athensensis]